MYHCEGLSKGTKSCSALTSSRTASSTRGGGPLLEEEKHGALFAASIISQIRFASTMVARNCTDTMSTNTTSDAETGKVAGVGESPWVDHTPSGLQPAAAADLSSTTGPILLVPPIASLNKDAEKTGKGTKKRRFGSTEIWECEDVDVPKKRSAKEEANQATRTKLPVFSHQKSKRVRLKKEESIDDSKSPVSETQASAAPYDTTPSLVIKNEGNQSFATTTCSQWAKKPHRPTKKNGNKGNAGSRKEAQRIRRNMRNRKAGAKARALEKQTMAALSQHYEALTVERRQLVKANAQLRIEVQGLLEQLALTMVAAKQLPALNKILEYPSLDTTTTKVVSMPCYSSNLVVDDKRHEEEQHEPTEEAAGLEPLSIEDCSALMENMRDDWWEDPLSATEEI